MPLAFGTCFALYRGYEKSISHFIHAIWIMFGCSLFTSCTGQSGRQAAPYDV